MSQDEAEKLLDKYLSGNYTPQEKEMVERWIARAGRQGNEWTALSPDEQRKYLQSMYQEVSHKIQAADKPRSEAITAHRRRRRLTIWMAAASVALFAVCGAILMLNHSRQGHGPASYVIATTAAGQIMNITLPDSTHVWLDAAATLRYPKSFAGPSREVFLKGEAFFEVAKNEQKPFIIQVGKVRARVLGTSFNVSGYPSDKRITVAVVSGKVEVDAGRRNGPDKVILQKDQVAVYEKASGQMNRRDDMNAADYAGWRNGMLSFRHTPMEDVIQRLYRQYDLKFIVENEAINRCEISGHFNVKEPAEDVIKAICLSIGAHFKITGNQVIISGPGCE